MADRIGVDWKAWVAWVIASVVGVDIVAMIIYSSILGADAMEIRGAVKEMLVVHGAIILAGLFYGGLQWLWWRKRIVGAKWWIAATVVGWYLGLGTLGLLSLAGVDPEVLTGWRRVAGVIIFYGAIGGAASLPQWLVVRRQFSQSEYWLLARPLGWLAGAGLMAGAEDLNLVGFDWLFGSNQILHWNVPGLVALCALFGLFGIGLGTVSGAAVIWMCRHPKEVMIGKS